MPPKRPTSPLYQSCILTLEKMLFDMWQKHYGNDCLPSHVKQDERLCAVRRYFSDNLAVPIRNDLFDSVLQKLGGFQVCLNSELFQFSGTLLIQMLFLLGGKGSAKLDFQTEKVESESDLAISYCRTAFLDIVIPDVCWANSLVILKLPFVVNPVIIRQISLHCPNLEVLNIKSRIDVSNPDPMITNLSWLYGQYPSVFATPNEPRGCPKLKVLELSHYGDDEEVIEHVVNMMKYMSGLHVVRNVDTRSIVLKYMEDSNNAVINFSEYEDWAVNTTEKLEGIQPVDVTITDKLPYVRSYRKVGIYEANISREIRRIINDFRYLKKLELSFNDVESLLDDEHSGLSPYLLELVIDVENDLVITEEVAVIGKMFPNLEILCFCSSALSAVTGFDDDNFNGCFNKLKSLELKNLAEFDSDFLVKFLIACPELHILMISVREMIYEYDSEPVHVLTDEVIHALIGYMGNLEKVWLTRECVSYRQMLEPLCLTSRSASNILLFCPRIKTLGDLNTWSINEAELKVLMSTVRRRNWDVNLDVKIIRP